MTVQDIDNGYRALVEQIEGLDKMAVLVGIFEQEGQARHDGGEGDAGDDVAIIDIATWHEFGLGVPERSFLRAFFDENKDKAREMLRTQLELVVKGKISVDTALKRFGLWAQAGIQQRIAQSIPPPLAEITIERKGSSIPLIDTGALRSAITFKVDKGT